MKLQEEEKMKKIAVCKTIEKLLNQTCKVRTGSDRYNVSYDSVKEVVVIRIKKFKKVLEVNVYADSVNALAEDVMKQILKENLFYKEHYFYEV